MCKRKSRITILILIVFFTVFVAPVQAFAAENGSVDTECPTEEISIDSEQTNDSIAPDEDENSEERIEDDEFEAEEANEDESSEEGDTDGLADRLPDTDGLETGDSGNDLAGEGMTSSEEEETVLEENTPLSSADSLEEDNQIEELGVSEVSEVTGNNPEESSETAALSTPNAVLAAYNQEEDSNSGSLETQALLRGTIANTTLDRIHFISLMAAGYSSDAALIESDGLYGLIDTSNPSGINNIYTDNTVPGANGQTVAEYLKNLNVDHLSFILGTHAHSDHIGGILDIVNAGLVDDNTVYIYKTYTGTSEDSYWHNDYYANLALDAMRSKNAVLLDTSAPSHSAMGFLGADFSEDSSGDPVGDNISFSLGDFMIRLYNLYRVSTTNENLNSIVTTVSKGESRAVLMADMQLEEEMESRVVSAIVRNEGTTHTDVYKLGHHGYMRSTGAETVETLKPTYAIISTCASSSEPGNKASFNYLMNALGTRIYRTSAARSALVAVFGENAVELKNLYITKNSAGATVETSFGLVEWKANYSAGWYEWIADSSGDSSRMYIDPSTGRAVTGWKSIDGTWYYFDDNYLAHRGWKTIGDSTYYLNTKGAMHKGWLLDDGKWYYLNAWGVLVKNDTVSIDGKQYIFDETGALITSWFCNNGNWYYLKEDGSVSTGWAKIDNNWYFFSGSGVMQKNAWISSGGQKYYVDGYGIMVTGSEWKQIGGQWYYFDAEDDGAVSRGIKQIGDKTYVLDPNSGAMIKNASVVINGKTYMADGWGYLKAGWQQVGGKWYYLDPEDDCTAMKGISEIEGKTYLLDPNTGAMLINTIIEIDGKRYGANGWGYLCTGWSQVGSKWYYFDPAEGGAAAKGITEIDDKMYVLDPNTGAMIINTVIEIDGKKYEADGWGCLLTGWSKINNKWYYFDPAEGGAAAKGITEIDDKLYVLDPNTGAMTVNTIVEIDGKKYGADGWGCLCTGWSKINNKWYYFDPADNNALATGISQIEDKVYLLDPVSGEMTVNKWLQINGKWYHADGWGYLQTGWVKLSDKWYYLGDDGAMQKNCWVTTSGKRYYVDGYGIMMTGPGWQKINGKWYYLDGSGAAKTGLLELNGNVYYLDEEGVMQTNCTIIIDGVAYYFNGYGIRQ